MKDHIKKGNNEKLGWDNLEDKFQIPYTRSKEQVWAKLEEQLEEQEKPQQESRVLKLAWYWAAAAMVLIVLGVGSFMRYYTIRVDVPAGEVQVVSLPDGSTVKLNAVSELAYHPYWWRINRQLSLTGEAYFEVKKGSRFSVVSAKGITSVLGTQFNVFARKEVYRVTCLSGKVRVTDAHKEQEVLLEANQQAVLDGQGKMNYEELVQFSDEAAWVNNEFAFRKQSLVELLEEVERAYDVEIVGKELIAANNIVLLSGRLNRNELTADQVLESLSQISVFKIEKIDSRKYRIFPKKN